MKKLTTKEFLERAVLVHGNKYDYSLVNYVNNKTKIDIICQIHGVFKQQPSNHITNQQGCPSCSIIDNLERNKKQASNTEEFLIKAKLIHGDKYDYSLVEYINKLTKVNIICKKHGVFSQEPRYHLRKSGCSKCNESKGEIIIENVLNNNNINFIKQKKFIDCKSTNLLPFDFYLPELNMCIEFDGEQHFKPIKVFGGETRFKKQQNTDKMKNEYCIKNKIILMRIAYNENIYDKLKNVLKLSTPS